MSSNKQNRGILLILSSTSGGGKSTIYKALLEKGDPFAFSVSATTRPIRSGEIDGVHYSFISDAEFDRMVEAGEFAEWALVHNKRYGSPRKYIDKALDENKVMIFEIDVQGAAQLKKAFPKDAVLVFIVAPSAAETEKRLRGRKSNTEEDINLRLENAREEIKHYCEYDYLVYNEVIEEAIEDILAIVRAESLAIKRFAGKIWSE